MESWVNELFNKVDPEKEIQATITPQIYLGWRIPKRYSCDFRMQFFNIEKQYKGLHIAGNLRDGIGMGQRILQGTLLGKEVLK
ncbi:hypothetical protein [Seramator thermalis]|uniref:hypothetical protein n=1 Tax=Seramator thermalis TaxID=2496270 RepID=UPI00101BC8E2|nr:hypothetical protein [Seramator thermalis]